MGLCGCHRHNEPNRLLTAPNHTQIDGVRVVEMVYGSGGQRTWILDQPAQPCVSQQQSLCGAGLLYFNNNKTKKKTELSLRRDVVRNLSLPSPPLQL